MMTEFVRREAKKVEGKIEDRQSVEMERQPSDQGRKPDGLWQGKRRARDRRGEGAGLKRQEATRQSQLYSKLLVNNMNFFISHFLFLFFFFPFDPSLMRSSLATARLVIQGIQPTWLGHQHGPIPMRGEVIDQPTEFGFNLGLQGKMFGSFDLSRPMNSAATDPLQPTWSYPAFS